MMSIATSNHVYGQQRTTASQKTEKRIPVLVSQNFVNEYPTAVDAEWRGYPQQRSSSEWYDYNLSKQSSKQSEYYVAEFTEFQSDYKAIYSADGNKIAVHRMFVSELPDPVMKSIQIGNYSNWSIAPEKEEIYRNNAMGSMKVYKVKMINGSSQRYLFYSEDGSLLKIKTAKQ